MSKPNFLCDFKCPYYSKEARGRIFCEFATIKPPDNISRRAFIEAYCGSGEGYKECPFYKIMDEYYQRKYPKSWKPNPNL